MPDERIGHDPLAWLMGGDGDKGEESHPAPAETPVAAVAPAVAVTTAAVEPAAPVVVPAAPVPAPQPQTADEVLRLEADLTVPTAAELQQRLRLQLDGRSLVELDGGEVERVDASGLQLLTGFVIAVEGQGGRVKWQAASSALREGARLTGLDGALRLS